MYRRMAASISVACRCLWEQSGGVGRFTGISACV
jgi:hypothetical protein